MEVTNKAERQLRAQVIALTLFRFCQPIASIGVGIFFDWEGGIQIWAVTPPHPPLPKEKFLKVKCLETSESKMPSVLPVAFGACNP